MGRRDGKIIDTIRIPELGQEIPLRMLKGDGGALTFIAEFGDERFSGTDATKVSEDLKKHVRATTDVKWTQIIVIEVQTQDRFDRDKTFLSLEFQRLYITRVGKVYKELAWDRYEGYETPSDRLRHAQFWMRDDDVKNGTLPVDKEGTYYRLYSEPLWNGLERLQALIKRAGKQLNNNADWIVCAVDRECRKEIICAVERLVVTGRSERMK